MDGKAQVERPYTMVLLGLRKNKKGETKMRRYEVSLKGISPVLPHGYNVQWSEDISKWRLDPLNTKNQKKGDDRSPAWTWIGSLYHDHKHIGIPSDNLMTCIRDGATKVIKSGKETYKSSSQSGMLVDQILWPIQTPKGLVKWDEIKKLHNEDDFEKHLQAAIDNGFELFVKPAKVGQSKHIRVRPRFDTWSASGSITVFDESLTGDVLNMIFTMAGNYCGICDWRPKSPKSPGSYGRFETIIKKIK
jgi:hypothetical protein